MTRMTCTCGAEMVGKRVPVTRSVSGRSITIQNVPALTCPKCENVLYKASTVKTMDALIRRNPDRDILLYPGFQGYNKQIVVRLSAGDRTFAQDLDEPVRRYDLACLESRFLKSLAPETR
jgi:YgiT-type zinc finger domain-containing protein